MESDIFQEWLISMWPECWVQGIRALGHYSRAMACWIKHLKLSRNWFNIISQVIPHSQRHGNGA